MHRINTPWRAVAAAFAFNGLLLGTWASRVPAVMEKHGLSEGGLGLQLLFMGMGALISFPVAGRLSDRVGALPVTRWLARGYLVSVVLVGLAPHGMMGGVMGGAALGLALFLFGMSHGAMDVTMNAWAAEVEKKMGRPVMSSFHAMWSLGAGAGAGLGFGATTMGLAVSWHFLLVALLGAAFLVPFLGLSWTSRVRPGGATDPVFALPRGPLILVGVIALSAGLGEGAVADWSAVFLRDTLGTSDAQATLGYALFSVVMVAMRLGADRVVERFGPGQVARLSGLLAAVGVLCVTGPQSYGAALFGFALMGAGYAVLVPLAFSRAAADPHVPPGQGIASVATLGYGAMLLGPPAIGQIAEIASLRVALVLIGGFALTAAALAPVLSRRPAGDCAA